MTKLILILLRLEQVVRIVSQSLPCLCFDSPLVAGRGQQTIAVIVDLSVTLLLLMDTGLLGGGNI